MTKVPIVVWCHAPEMYDRVYEDGVNLHDERWRCKSWPLMLIDLKLCSHSPQSSSLIKQCCTLQLIITVGCIKIHNGIEQVGCRSFVLPIWCVAGDPLNTTALALVMGITSACISSTTTPDFKTVHRHNCDQYASNMVSDQMVPPPVPNHGHTIWSQWSKCSQPFPIRVGGSQASHLLQPRKDKK